MKRRSFLRLALLFLTGCTLRPDQVLPPTPYFIDTPTPEPTPSPTAAPVVPTSSATPTSTVPTSQTATPVTSTLSPEQFASCRLEPLVAPTRPAATPGPDMLDRSTGLHVTGNRVVELDPHSYRLKITGLVDHPLEITLDELRCMPKVSARVNLTCKGNFEDVTSYTGVPLLHVLGLAGVQAAAQSVSLTGAEGYPGYLSLEDATKNDNFLAYQWENEPLPILHGFPLRAVIPSLFGYKWTKFLVEIKVE